MIDSDRKRTQDREASSHKEGIAEYAPTCAFMSCFFLTLIFYKNILNSEYLFCKSFEKT